MIKLIVSDIDGTMVPEGNTDINQEYLEVIKKLTEKGIVFAAASGRHASSIHAVFQPVSERIYYVSDNGACIEKNGKEERALYLPAKELRELLYEARKMEGCYVMFSAVDGFYTDAKDETFSEGVLGGYKGNKSVVEDLEAYVDKSIKMAIYCPDGAIDIYKEVNKRWGDRFSVNISGDRWVDINLQEATKGKAVAWIQQQTGASPKETVVFGDNFNDMSMLKQAHYSFASELSHPDVKAAAHYQVASWKVDGVLAVLKRILENEEAFLADPEGTGSDTSEVNHAE